MKWNLGDMLLVVAGALTVVHGGYVLADRVGSASRHVLTPGSALRAEIAPLFSGSRPTSACTLAFVVDPDCESCRALAKAADWQESPQWLSVGNDKRTIEFAETFSLDTTRVARLLVEGAGSPFERLEHIGIGGVPMRVVLDNDNVVRHVELTWHVPPPDSVDSICQAPLD